MIRSSCEISLKNAEQTADLARRIGARLTGGDCILLEGSIGAGKTHFARALIQSRLAVREDVPSPTFTLVQIYDLPDAELWHADLYRLSDPDEAHELGLADAFDTAICLVEWPDKLGPDTPAHALHLRLTQDPDDPDARQISLRWSDPKWTQKLDPLNDD